MGGAVATSGTYERGLHVINPFSREPATELVAVTVVGRSSSVRMLTPRLRLQWAPPHQPGWKAWSVTRRCISPDGQGWSTQGFKDLQSALPVTTPG